MQRRMPPPPATSTRGPHAPASPPRPFPHSPLPVGERPELRTPNPAAHCGMPGRSLHTIAKPAAFCGMPGRQVVSSSKPCGILRYAWPIAHPLHTHPPLLGITPLPVGAGQGVRSAGVRSATLGIERPHAETPREYLRHFGACPAGSSMRIETLRQIAVCPVDRYLPNAIPAAFCGMPARPLHRNSPLPQGEEPGVRSISPAPQGGLP